MVGHSQFLASCFQTLKDACRARFVLPHYHAYVRVDGGMERRVTLSSCELDSEFIADPFLLHWKGENWLFFEGLFARRGNRGRVKGVIGCLRETTTGWHYEGVVLEEPWHLSYPQIFVQGGRVYMIPESGQSGAVSLYECTDFPRGWVKRGDLVRGACNYVDATLVFEDGFFYLVMTPAAAPQSPELWVASALMGPWSRHPRSEAVSSALALRRNGGAFLREGGALFRVAQDCDGGYGLRLFCVPVLRLGRDDYAEGRPETLAEKVGWPQPLAHHTYNRLVTEAGVLEVVDRHYNTGKPPLAFLASVFWFVFDGVRLMWNCCVMSAGRRLCMRTPGHGKGEKSELHEREDECRLGHGCERCEVKALHGGNCRFGKNAVEKVGAGKGDEEDCP